MKQVGGRILGLLLFLHRFLGKLHKNKRDEGILLLNLMMIARVACLKLLEFYLSDL
ncbi:MAG: hypothetical protein ACPGMR_04015 [Pontibacterium sp.]